MADSRESIRKNRENISKIRSKADDQIDTIKQQSADRVREIEDRIDTAMDKQRNTRRAQARDREQTMGEWVIEQVIIQEDDRKPLITWMDRLEVELKKLKSNYRKVKPTDALELYYDKVSPRDAAKKLVTKKEYYKESFNLFESQKNQVLSGLRERMDGDWYKALKISNNMQALDKMVMKELRNGNVYETVETLMSRLGKSPEEYMELKNGALHDKDLMEAYSPKQKEAIEKVKQVLFRDNKVGFYTASGKIMVQAKDEAKAKKILDKAFGGDFTKATGMSVKKSIGPKKDFKINAGYGTMDEAKDEADFKPHMMYDPKTGKGYKADTYKDHVRMDKMGYKHEKPKLDEAKVSKTYKVDADKQASIVGTLQRPEFKRKTRYDVPTKGSTVKIEFDNDRVRKEFEKKLNESQRFGGDTNIPASKDITKYIESGKGLIIDVPSTLHPTARFAIHKNPAKGSGQDKVLMATTSNPKRGRVKMFSFHGTHVSHQKAMDFAAKHKLIALTDKDGNKLHSKYESMEHAISEGVLPYDLKDCDPHTDAACAKKLKTILGLQPNEELPSTGTGDKGRNNPSIGQSKGALSNVSVDAGSMGESFNEAKKKGREKGLFTAVAIEVNKKYPTGKYAGQLNDVEKREWKEVAKFLQAEHGKKESKINVAIEDHNGKVVKVFKEETRNFVDWFIQED